MGTLCPYSFFCLVFGVRYAHADFDILSPVRRLEKSQTGGGVGEDCLSTQCEFRTNVVLSLNYFITMLQQLINTFG